MSDDEILAEMRAKKILVENDRQTALVMSDTFGYAGTHLVQVASESMAEVIDIYRRFGPVGCICWAAKRRNEDPVIEYTEDPVYQETWAAIYGNARVRPNDCNQSDPRWLDDDERLELPLWK